MNGIFHFQLNNNNNNSTQTCQFFVFFCLFFFSNLSTYGWLTKPPSVNRPHHVGWAAGVKATQFAWHQSLEIFPHSRFKVLLFCHSNYFFYFLFFLLLFFLQQGKKLTKKSHTFLNIFVLKAKSITEQFDISWSFFWKCFFSYLQNCHLPIYCGNGHLSSVTSLVKSNLYVFVWHTKKKKREKMVL